MTALLAVSHVSKSFGRRRREPVAPAVADVSFELAAGETLGLVGESGAGKSTLARLVTRLVEPDSGAIRFADVDVTGLPGRELRGFRAQISTVFQNPYRSFDPRMLTRRALAEPLRVQGTADRATRRRQVAEVLETVRLGDALLDRYPYELSGGQLQRLAVARALVTDPRAVILDEPTSGLDVSVRASLINLLADVQRERNVAFLLISHDLWVVATMAQRIVVLKEGSVVEAGSNEAVCTRPEHPYTQQLMAARPDPFTAQCT